MAGRAAAAAASAQKTMEGLLRIFVSLVLNIGDGGREASRAGGRWHGRGVPSEGPQYHGSEKNCVETREMAEKRWKGWRRLSYGPASAQALGFRSPRGTLRQLARRGRSIA